MSKVGGCFAFFVKSSSVDMKVSFPPGSCVSLESLPVVELRFHCFGAFSLTVSDLGHVVGFEVYAAFAHSRPGGLWHAPIFCDLKQSEEAVSEMMMTKNTSVAARVERAVVKQRCPSNMARA